MRLFLFACLVLAACLGSIRADEPAPPAPPPVTASKLPDPLKPTEVRTPPGVPVKLASPKPVKWEPGCEAAGRLYLIADKSGTEATAVASKPGRYLLLAFAGDTATPAARVVLVVADETPDPAPQPPPVPPGPTPVPPPAPPVDAFAVAVRAAFVADSEPDKAAKAVTLATLYQLATKYAATDPTPAALVERVRQASVTLELSPTDLAGVRRLVGDELKAAADPNKPFDADARKRVSDVYRRAAAALLPSA